MGEEGVDKMEKLQRELEAAHNHNIKITQKAFFFFFQ